jgi:hypothetical protein
VKVNASGRRDYGKELRRSSRAGGHASLANSWASIRCRARLPFHKQAADAALEAAALFYSLIETAKLRGLDPRKNLLGAADLSIHHRGRHRPRLGDLIRRTFATARTTDHEHRASHRKFSNFRCIGEETACARSPPRYTAPAR